MNCLQFASKIKITCLFAFLRTLGPGRPSAGGPRMDRRAVTSPGVVKILRLASRLRRSAGRGTYPTAVLIKHLMKKILFNSHYRSKHGILRPIDNMRNERYPMHYDGCMLCPITKPVTQSSHHLYQINSPSSQTFVRDHLLPLFTILLTSVNVLPIIEPPPLVAPRRLKQQVCNLVDICELWKASEKDDLVDQRQELPLKGGDQGLLLLKGQAEQVPMVMSQTKEVILKKMSQKVFSSVKTSSGERKSLYRKFRYSLSSMVHVVMLQDCIMLLFRSAHIENQ